MESLGRAAFLGEANLPVQKTMPRPSNAIADAIVGLGVTKETTATPTAKNHDCFSRQCPHDHHAAVGGAVRNGGPEMNHFEGQGGY